MRIITERRLKELGDRPADARGALDVGRRQVKAARWRSLDDVRSIYPHADEVTVASERVVTVFNIRGNNYRLVTAIHYNTQCVYVMRFLTHAEYDKDAWKEQL